MSTAQSIIDNALQILGVSDPAETPTTTERDIGLIELNKIIDEWSASGIRIPWLTQDLGLSLTGTNVYTIGSGQTFNTALPLLIKSASCQVSSSSETPCEVITIEEYQAIRDKQRTGKLATKIAFVVLSASVGSIYVWPKANASVLNLWSYKPLTTLASLATSLSFPVGYESAIQQVLALRLAPRYGRAVNDLALLVKSADEAMATIQNRNAALFGALPSLVQQVTPAPQG